ncbi:MAG TPA: hypothetical protein VK943_14360 [Arenibaculum sp.]|nr:hypothetical protein [Arenibaculum sp.]
MTLKGTISTLSIIAASAAAATPAAAFLEEKLLGKGVRNVAWLFQTNMSVFTSKGKPLPKPEDFKASRCGASGRPSTAA